MRLLLMVVVLWVWRVNGFWGDGGDGRGNVVVLVVIIIMIVIKT